MPAVGSWLRYADSARVVNESLQHLSASDRIESMVRENVIAQIENIKTHPSVRLAIREGRLALHGWVYDIETGSIDALDGTTINFVPLADNTEVRAYPIQLHAAV